MYETCKNTQNGLQHFCSPKKVVPNVSTRYNREQLGKYTGKLLVTTDPGIRVWYGMVVYQKDGKTCEGSPLSALQAYNQIISLLCSYYFPSVSMLFPMIFHISLVFPYCSLLFLLFTYYFPLSSLFWPYYFPIYNFLILPYYCPICLPGFQNDKLRHLEWLCFDCHAKCLKPAKIHIIWFPTKTLDFTVFLMTFSQKKRLSKPKNDDPSRWFSLFCSSTCYSFDGHAECMKPAKTHKMDCNTFAAPKKWFQMSPQDIIGNN